MSLLLALTLLPPPVELTDDEQYLRASRDYWIGLGVLEEEEWRFVEPVMAEEDHELMVWRLLNTPDDAPPLLAHLHLPYEHALDKCADSWSYCSYLDQMLVWAIDGDEKDAIELVRQDAKRRGDVWRKVWHVTGRYSGQDGRRKELDELRQMVGDDVFYGRKEWPAALPDAAYSDPSWRVR